MKIIVPLTVSHTPIVSAVTTKLEVNPADIARTCPDDVAMNLALGNGDIHEVAAQLIHQAIGHALDTMAGTPQTIGELSNNLDFIEIRYKVCHRIFRHGNQLLAEGRRPNSISIKLP